MLGEVLAIEELVEERERHWLRCKKIMGLPATHDYKKRLLWEEGIKELVDFVNYMDASGQPGFAARGRAFAAEVLEESRKPGLGASTGR